MAKSFFDELTGYRVKVERDGREIVNMPGILALPGLLIAPKLSIAGMIAAPLLGCSIRLENDDGRDIDIGEAVKDAADAVADTATAAARTVREEVEKAWNDLSAEDPEGCPEEKENGDDPAGQANTEEGIPTIQVDPDDPDQQGNPDDPDKS